MTPQRTPPARSLNLNAMRAIFVFEISRLKRTVMQSLISPVLTTCLYFVVFGAAIGGRINEIDGVTYGAFIVPGLIMLSLLTQSVSFAAFGIYFQRFTGTIYEILSAPISPIEIVVGYVGAAAAKAILLAVLILATAALIVPIKIAHPAMMVILLVLTAITFALLGFIIGLWADNFEELQAIPLLVLTPLTFLGGTFYSIEMLPPVWQTVSLFNPIVYLVSAFRWSFTGVADVSVVGSFLMIIGLMLVSLLAIVRIFITGWRLKR